MVDFVGKALETDEDYKDIRKKFYEEKLTELNNSTQLTNELVP